MTAKQIMLATLIAVILIMLCACADDSQRVMPVRTVDVNVPALETRPVPDELKHQPIPAASLPLWVSPKDPAASSCLTVDGESKKRLLDTGIMGKLDAWEKWGITK